MSQIFYIVVSIILAILFLFFSAVLVIFAAIMQHEERMKEHARTHEAQNNGRYQPGRAAGRYTGEMP